MSRDIQFTFSGFLAWSICALFFLYEFLLRTVIGTFQRPIMYDLQLSFFKYSLLSTTTYLLIYGVMQFPVSMAVDSLGLKKSLAIGAIICVISSFGFCYVESYPSALFFRMLMGLGSSFGFICLLMAVFDWMPSRHLALFIGLSQFVGTLGPMLAAGPLETISHQSALNWRFVFFCLGIAGLIILILVIFFVKNNPEKQGKYIILQRPEKLKRKIAMLFSRWQPWLIAIFSGCTYCAIEYLSENEGKDFIQLKGFNAIFSSYMLTLAWLGYAIGCPVLGFLSDLFQRRKIFMIFAAMSCVVSIIFITFSSNRLILMLSFLLLGIGCSGQSIGFVIIAENFKKKFLAAGLGINNAVITFVGAVNAPFLGWLIDRAKIKYDSINAYYSSFFVLIAVSMIAFLISWRLIKESYSKSLVESTIVGNHTCKLAYH